MSPRMKGGLLTQPGDQGPLFTLRGLLKRATDFCSTAVSPWIATAVCCSGWCPKTLFHGPVGGARCNGSQAPWSDKDVGEAMQPLLLACCGPAQGSPDTVLPLGRT